MRGVNLSNGDSHLLLYILKFPKTTFSTYLFYLKLRSEKNNCVEIKEKEKYKK